MGDHRDDGLHMASVVFVAETMLKHQKKYI